MLGQNRLGVRAHIWLGTTAIVVILLGAGFYSLYQVKALQEINSKMYRHPMAVSVAVISVDGKIHQLQSLLKDAALTKKTKVREGIVANISTLEVEIEAEMNIVRDRFLGPAEMLTAVSAELDKWPVVRDKVVAVAKKKNRSATQRSLNNDLGEWVDLMEPPIKAVKQFAEEKGIAFYENATAAAEHAFQWALSFFAAGILFSSAVGVWTIRSVMRPLGAEPVVVRELVAELAQGNLAIEIPVRPNDQHSLLGSISDLRDNLSRLVGVVRSNAENVGAASEQIYQGNSELSVHTEQQSYSLQKTTSSMEELNTTVANSSETASRANTLALEATEVACNSSEVVSQVVQTMDQISGSSHQITEITGLIDSIAFQTNLLALNAAVEAARAGEQGKGFAVVASEVRTLAQRSAEAAKQINGLITTSVEHVETGTQLAHQARETMANVLNSVKEVTELMSDLDTANADQRTGVEQVGVEMKEMDSATQRNTKLVHECALATKNLRGQAELLLDAVDAFKQA